MPKYLIERELPGLGQAGAQHIGAGLAIGNVIDFPKHDHLTVLALAHRSAELISLLDG